MDAVPPLRHGAATSGALLTFGLFRISYFVLSRVWREMIINGGIDDATDADCRNDR